ncbi:Molybdate-binding protein ModA [Paraglaciecola mesophila]|uniref:Molybdate-binding protein ModA n=1 Tax=Paraglaciecola mesophila TaxID=197222 RepID=A0A857JEV6_9ALTE|nr:molybdate ABC transporter substrate-binding protein [Paraglaciecola mesophila]QHJ10206.1 Molybdate-binding protein ModA [Paraglaciecola mesophila]
MPVFAHAEVKVAVAANFKPTLVTLIEEYTRLHPKADISVSSASTGVLYAQINRGAPFDIFLSADSDRPKRLEKKGLVETNTRKNYALGQLVLWRKGFTSVNAESLNTLTGKLAIANPKLAPFGQAAKQALHKLGKYAALQSRIVLGNNVSQTAHYVQSGAAEAGFIALSQVIKNSGQSKDYWLLPSHLYSPINQQMVVLKQSGRSAAETREVMAFHHFILSDTGRSIITNSGYQSSEMQSIPRVKPDAQ